MAIKVISENEVIIVGELNEEGVLDVDDEDLSLLKQFKSKFIGEMVRIRMVVERC